MKKLLLFFGLVLLSVLNYAQDKSQIKMLCDKTKSTITYYMNHPFHSWSAVCSDVTSAILVDEDKNVIKNVAVSAKISSFDSKNANRDSHTMEVTDALIYPTVTFTSSSIKQEGNKLSVTGSLVFHGVNQTISFIADKKTSNSKTEVTGNFVVKMSQHKIKPPTLMMIPADDDIKIFFDVFY